MVDVYVDDVKKKLPPHQRSSQWGPPEVRMFVHGVPHELPGHLSEKEYEALLLRIRIEEITTKLNAPVVEVDLSHDRPPSPPPIYDRDGKRTNTREQRMRVQLQIERQDLIHDAMKLLPTFRPPGDYRPLTIRKNRKLYIPVDKYPDYNFIGLIIGPRGMTQKQMEKQTGAKIAIRGKGSVKDGKVNQGDQDKLHVLITAETDKALDMASKMVQKLLIPVEEGQNEHKRLQLRKLAEINGTLRDNMYGRPRDMDSNYDGPNVSCEFCGDPSHPSRDCPVRAAGGRGKQEDVEYQNFLADIGGGGGGPAMKRTGANQVHLDRVNSEANLQAYHEFMAAIGEQPSDPTQVSERPPWEQDDNPPWLGGGGGGGGHGGGGDRPPWESSGAPPWQQQQSHAQPVMDDPLQKFMQSL